MSQNVAEVGYAMVAMFERLTQPAVTMEEKGGAWRSGGECACDID